MFNVRRCFCLAVISLLLLTLAPLALAQANTVNVTLVSFQIEMPASLPAGPTTFTITNDGTHEHNFEVEGNGIEEKLEANLRPGESGTLEVDLQPGTYEVYCPVGDHRDQGMFLELTVTGEATETTTGTEPQAVPEATSEAAQAEAQAAPEATPQTAQEQPAALPATGGVLSPWSGILLVGLGLLVLIGGLSLALARRTR
jgi:plastocyanin